MKLTRRLAPTLILALACIAGPARAGAPIERIEPPNWWAGMSHRGLQLMVHGEQVGTLSARIQAPGVKLVSQRAADSPNYLFLQLELAPSVKPGRVAIDFMREGRVVATESYELRARAAGSAQRKGFDTADAVYLVVPDRFANGDPSNDDIPATHERPNRADPGGRHGGDLAGVIAHLDYMQRMGFTQLWLTPVEANDQDHYSYHGYAITDFYRVDPRLGTNADYLKLAAQAKDRGIGLIHDIVLNHIGNQHWWMADLPMRDWINHGKHYEQTNHAHIAALDPHAAKRDRESFTAGWFVDTMPDLNQRQPLLAEYLIQNTIWWIESAGLAGIREDTFSYAEKPFLAQWTRRVLAEYPKLTLVGEEMSDDAAMVAYWQRGARNRDGYDAGMPSMMDFPVQGALRAALTTPEGHQRGLYELYAAMAHDAFYPDAARLTLFAGNHDRSRIFAALDGDLALQRIALAFVATAPRIPQFFYGDEIALRGPKEQDDGLLRADFPGGWAGDAVDAFTGRGLAPELAELQSWLARLLNWRKTSAAIAQGRMTQYVPQEGSYVFFRHTPGLVMVAINRRDQPLTLDLSRFDEVLPQAGVTATDVTSGRRIELNGSLTLPPKSVLVLDAGPR
ncbi:glycoside hydrolase family 13 protein [Burkholderiaceae bacterium UC74_6]